ncbi:MAG: M1 family aminopeptidase [Ferruginibacter sp.]
MHQKTGILMFVLFIMLCSVSAQQPGSIKKMPAANHARLSNIDVKHIAIDLRFDWKKKQAYGTTSITLVPTIATKNISLDAGMLSIQSITLTNGTALKFSYDGTDKNDGLAIELDRIYKKDESLMVKISYRTNWVNNADPNNTWGSFGKGIRFFEPTSTVPTKRRQAWSMGYPQSNRYWFPCHDVPNDLRTTEFTATVDESLMAISNGTLVKTINNHDGTRTYHWKMNTPYPNHYTSFVVGEYVDVKQNYKSIPLHSFGYPDEKVAVAATTVRLPDMVRYFTELSGINYPYSNYSQVVVQDFAGLSGHSTVPTITDNMIDDYRTHADFFYLWDGTEAHALASQWFGNLISCSDWSDVWLNESFCHYFDGLYTDHKNGHDEFLSYYYPFDITAVLGDWNAGYRHPIVTKHYDNVETFTRDNYASRRGALVLRMLQKQLGDAAWWKAIRYYVKKNAGRQVSTKDLQMAIEESTGQSLEWFFDQWIYKMGLPVFDISKNYDSEKKQLILYIRQTQKTDPADEYPQVDFFKGKVDIEIDGHIEQVWIEPKAENIFIFTSAQQPKLINFDYESTWIKEMVFEKSLDELLYQLENDKDITGKWWAIDQLVKLHQNEKTTAEEKIKIYNGFRNTISGNSYWRLRAYAMSKLRSMLKPPLDEPTISMLLKLIQNEKSWIRTGAINSLGMTADAKYTNIYLKYLNDESDRVINAAATALGKTKSPLAFDALVKLKDKPSWKNQSLISALNGFKELDDPRGVDIALTALTDLNGARWWLATSIWDFRLTAAETLVALGKGEKGYQLIYERFKKSMDENDYNDIFGNVQLITTLADPRGQEVFDQLKIKFKEDANAMTAVNQYEAQFKEAVKSK